MVAQCDGVQLSGKYPVRFIGKARFLDKLVEADRDYIVGTITNTRFTDSPSNERTVVRVLGRPFEERGVTVVAIRMKGVLPKPKSLAAESGIQELMGHTGSGFVPDEIQVTPNGYLELHRHLESNPHEPEGTMSWNRCEVESRTAKEFGYPLTDVLLDFGLYDTLRYQGNPTGFAVYGMDQIEDVRFSDVILQGSNWGVDIFADSAYQALAERLGRLLRKIHDHYRIVHRYPAPHNWGTDRNLVTLRILDLNTCLSMTKMTARERAAWRFVDLERAVVMFYRRYVNVKSQFGDNLPYAWPLLAKLFMGYFYLEEGTPFYQYARHLLHGEVRCRQIQMPPPFGIPAEHTGSPVHGVWYPPLDYPFTVIQALREPLLRQMLEIPESVLLDEYFARRTLWNGPVTRMFWEAISGIA